MSTEEFAPGRPESVEITKPATLPCNASIALESHDNYDEIWIPDSKVVYYLEDEVGDIKRHVATRYERVLIRRGKKHKIINPSAVELCIFEMQLGRIESGDKKLYLSEDSSYGK